MTKRLLVSLGYFSIVYVSILFFSLVTLEKILPRNFSNLAKPISIIAAFVSSNLFSLAYAQRTKPRKILVVGNTDGFRPIFGYDVLIVPNLDEAEKALLDFAPDIVQVNEVFDLMEARKVIRQRFAHARTDVEFFKVDSAPRGMTDL